MFDFISIVLLAAIVPVLTWIDFFSFLIGGQRFFGRLKFVLQALVMLGPAMTLVLDLGQKNDCCGDSAIFSPQHRLSAIVLVLVCLSAFFYSTCRKRLAPPLLEIIVNCLLNIGIVFDIFVGIHLKEWHFWFFGVLPVANQFLLVLAENHQLALDSTDQRDMQESSPFLSVCRKIVFLPYWQKMPLLLLLCVPVLTFLVAVLLLFGQKPDSLVKAFTDTYKHGFSTLDYQCAGVVCGGHFLCTIAAKGSPRLVKPTRVGVRAGRIIQCNRQLLVSNAFEELLEQKLPWLHRPVRTIYNKIGDGIHRYYVIFDRQWVSNCIYVLMKPLEWIFLFVLYLTYRHPENRIAQQYLHRDHRKILAAYPG